MYICIPTTYLCVLIIIICLMFKNKHIFKTEKRGFRFNKRIGIKMRKEIVYKIQIEIQNKNYNERLKIKPQTENL